MSEHHGLRRRLPVLSVALAGVLWGIIGPFVRTLSGMGLQSMQIVAFRAIITAVLLFVVLMVRDRGKLRFHLRDIWCFLGTGLCSIVFFNFCYFSAIEDVSLSVASVLLYTAPCIVMLLSLLLFHERITTPKLIALAMSVIGLCLVTGLLGGGGNRATPHGILMGLGAGLGYALYSIFGRYALDRGYHPLTITFYTFAFASVGSLVLCQPAGMVHVLVSTPAVWLPGVLLGVLCTVLPFASYTWGLARMESSRASIVASVEPVVATLLGVFAFGEAMTVGNFAGVVLVVAAIAVLQEPWKKQETTVHAGEK